MLRDALESDASPYPERIRVGTIHEAKGLQASCVFRFTETTQNIMDRCRLECVAGGNIYMGRRRRCQYRTLASCVSRDVIVCDST